MSRQDHDYGFGNKRNRLFSAGRNYMLNACVGRNGGPVDFDRLGNGYFTATAALIEYVRQNPFDVDSLIYPIVQNARHAVELSLKYLVGVLSTIAEQHVAASPTHKLTDNWERVRKLILHLELATKEELKHVTHVISEFVEFDPNGEAFRYPTSKNGDLCLNGVSHINVDVFADRIRFAGAFLQNLCFHADHLYDMYCEGKSAELDHLQELEAEWQEHLRDLDADYLSDLASELASLEAEFNADYASDAYEWGFSIS